MGVSEVGKMTLMDVLAGTKTGGYIEGSITISGYPKKQETFPHISSYCEQTDIHSPFVTIYESLVYYAWLHLPSDVYTALSNPFSLISSNLYFNNIIKWVFVEMEVNLNSWVLYSNNLGKLWSTFLEWTACPRNNVKDWQ